MKSHALRVLLLLLAAWPAAASPHPVAVPSAMAQLAAPSATTTAAALTGLATVVLTLVSGACLVGGGALRMPRGERHACPPITHQAHAGWSVNTAGHAL